MTEVVKRVPDHQEMQYRKQMVAKLRAEKEIITGKIKLLKAEKEMIDGKIKSWKLV